MFRGALFIIAVVVLIIAIGFFVLPANRQAHISSFVIPEIRPQKNLARSDLAQITIFAVGDIMLDRGVEYMVKQYGKGDFRFPFLKIAPVLQKASLVFGNLEGPISNRGERVGSIYSFRAELEAAQALKFAGFDIVSLANNHMFDYQAIALEDTMTILLEQGIDYVGAGFDTQEAFEIKIKEKGGMKIGFLAYTNLGPDNWRAKPNRLGIAWINKDSLPHIMEYIEEVKELVDVLVVSLHAGVEYSSVPTAFQTAFARACVESGADLVIGHHPHVIQPVEKYQDGWIAYSLGNFVFDQGFSDETITGLLLKVIIENHKIKQVIPQTIKLNQYFQPEIVN